MIGLQRDLSQRERLGLVALAMTAVLFVAWVWGRPALTDNRGRAHAQLQEASALLVWAEQRQSSTTTPITSATETPAAPAERRQLLIDLATRRGLTISRLQKTDAGIVVQTDAADPRVFFAWLAEAETAHAIVPNEVVLATQSEGLVSANLLFEGS